MEKLDVLIPVITTIIGSVTTMLVIWYKHKLERNKQKDECPIVKCVAEDSELLNKLTEVNKSLKSDRISIYSFHNGGEYYSGKSMQKMSVSYEVVDKGISHAIRKTKHTGFCLYNNIRITTRKWRNALFRH